jgi:hypothetical protein
MSNLDRLAIYLAAIVHDLDHPGLNNQFLITTKSSKALLYNDRSVLENHHVAAAFLLLEDPKYNFVKTLSKVDFKYLRTTVIDLVLATDLSHHYQLLGEFKLKV